MKTTNGGYVVSKCRAFLLFIVFIGSLIAVGLLVYFLAGRPVASSATNGASTTASSSTSGSNKAEVTSNKNVRLPRAVLPIRYDVRLFPILEKGNFSILGHVSIDLNCKMETDRIVLHSTDIVIDPKSIKVQAITYDQAESRIDFFIVFRWWNMAKQPKR